MARPTAAHINASALLHNVGRVRQCAPGKKIIAMVKANAYGCGLSSIIPVLEGHVDAFGVACSEEAMAVRELGSRTDCVLFQGVFSAEELQLVVAYDLQCVIHEAQQLQWILATPLPTKIKVWVKVNTGMHRLGFPPVDVSAVINSLVACPWVDENIGLMTHLACADEPEHESNAQQLQCFNNLPLFNTKMTRSIANSAAILSLPEMHADVVRPGIMLYGVSPFANKTGLDLGLLPVMRLMSVISTIHDCPSNAPVGYGATWQSDKPSRIGVVAIGYGDGYPRHVSSCTPTWINGSIAPIVGRVSMDMLTVDLTHCPDVKIGDEVELWGNHIPVETIAKSAGTSAYELICQTSSRVRGNNR
jgi:alanine racemase